ncbi:MAG: YeeE/YedE family protein [Saprospiraceae bacterium]|nr:YeeE/YedE family protein [Saprospiraceae bacterium]
MKHIPFLLIGILFGIIMTKSEVISWFRIQEMFRFESFHMYGVIGTAVALGILIIALIKRKQKLDFKPTPLSIRRHLIAGSIFGLGWALAGACPGPMYTLLGNGYIIFLIIILSALAGTYTYGLVRDKLPH